MGEPLVLASACRGSRGLVVAAAVAHERGCGAARCWAPFSCQRCRARTWLERTTWRRSGLKRRRRSLLHPQFGRPFSWTVYARTGEYVRAWSVDSRVGYISSAFAYRDASALPGVEQSRDIPVVHTFLELSMIPSRSRRGRQGPAFRPLVGRYQLFRERVRCLVLSRRGRQHGATVSGHSNRQLPAAAGAITRSLMQDCQDNAPTAT